MKTEQWHSLKGKKIWVFGGAGYFGSAITKALDAECEHVVCVDLAERASELVARENLERTAACSLNTSHIEELEAFVEDIARQHGVPDGMVNLTFASSSGKRLEDLTAAEFAKPFDDSVTSFFVLSRALAEKMKSLGRGSIVHYASMYGMVSPDPGIYKAPQAPNPIDYGASKAAILQMNRYLAVHYAHSGVRFNCVVPGPFPHPGLQQSHPDFVQELARKTPMNRIGFNHEVVGPTLFLLTDSASYVTGQSLVVDGGWTAW